MLHIAICDDNDTDLKEIHACVSKTMFDLEDIRIDEFLTGEDLIHALEEQKDTYELVLLDICMNPLDGLEVAEHIRNQKLDVDIIFITNSRDFVFKGYEYRAYSYILKSSMEELLPKNLQRYTDELNSNEACINVVSAGEKIRIPVSQIVYVESDGRKLILHLQNREVSIYGKMNDFQEMFDGNEFLRIHQSYLVARNKIDSVRKDTVVLGETELPFSRRYADQVRHVFD